MPSWASCTPSGRRWPIARERGEDPAGATMYVTLEPCAHQGRQPPCVEAILEAGIARVVIASDDPSEKAAGRGPGILRDGGVEVEFAAGEEATAARLLNQPFRKHARTGLPLVTLKLAMSLDGQTATAARRLALDLRRAEPRAGPPLARRIRRDRRRHRHRPRRRPPPDRPPRRCALSRPKAPDGHASRFASSSTARPACRSIRSCSRPSTSRRCSWSSLRKPTHRLCATAGAEVLVADGIEAALAELGRRGITSLFLEGGQTLAAAFADAGADRRGASIRRPGPARPAASAPRRSTPAPTRHVDRDPLQGVVMFTGLIEDIGRIESLRERRRRRPPAHRHPPGRGDRRGRLGRRQRRLPDRDRGRRRAASRPRR